MDLCVRFESGAQGKYIKLFGASIEDALKMKKKAQSFLNTETPKCIQKIWRRREHCFLFMYIYTKSIIFIVLDL